MNNIIITIISKPIFFYHGVAVARICWFIMALLRSLPTTSPRNVFPTPPPLHNSPPPHPRHCGLQSPIQPLPTLPSHSRHNPSRPRGRHHRLRHLPILRPCRGPPRKCPPHLLSPTQLLPHSHQGWPCCHRQIRLLPLMDPYLNRALPAAARHRLPRCRLLPRCRIRHTR